jgi:hypothetical protein
MRDALRQMDSRTFAHYYNGSGQADYYADLITDHINAFHALPDLNGWASAAA